MKTFKGGIEEFDQKIFKLRQLQNETFQASNLSQLRLKETDLLVKRHEAILQNSIDRVTHVQAAQRAEITGDKVKKLFEETHKIVEEHGIEYGLAAAKGIERAATKSEGGEEKTNEPSDEAHYSIGVQLKSLAQTHLRNMELYLGLAAADADLLQSISLVEPVLVPDCFNLLSEMLDALAHLKAKDEQPQNVKVDVMRAFEKLIWSLLLKEEIEKFLVPPEVRFMVPTSETEEPFITSSGPFPDRLKEYFRARFSTEATQREEDVLRQMVELADAFTKASEQQDPFTVTRLAFKHGSNSSGNG